MRGISVGVVVLQAADGLELQLRSLGLDAIGMFLRGGAKAASVAWQSLDESD
jgi:hypothetical protein